jgi:hypothetical protein
MLNTGVDNSLASEWAKGSCPDKGQCSAPAVFSPAYGSGYKYAWFSVGGNDFIFEGCINFFGMLKGKIQRAIQAVHAAGPPGMKILMTGYCIPPSILNQFVCRDTESIAELNGAIGEACTTTPGCTFVDATSACGGSPHTFSDPRLFADYIHPNEEGFQKIFGMPAIQDFFGCKTSGDICKDVRYPYYRDVNGYVVCYSSLPYAQGAKGAPCNSWCTTTLEAGDNCNGCCGDMQQRLCNGLATLPPTTPYPVAGPGTTSNLWPPAPKSAATITTSIPGSMVKAAVFRNQTETSKDEQKWNGGLIIIAAASVVIIGFLCGSAIGGRCGPSDGSEASLSRSSSRQSMAASE